MTAAQWGQVVVWIIGIGFAGFAFSVVIVWLIGTFFRGFRRGILRDEHMLIGEARAHIAHLIGWPTFDEIAHGVCTGCAAGQYRRWGPVVGLWHYSAATGESSCTRYPGLTVNRILSNPKIVPARSPQQSEV